MIRILILILILLLWPLAGIAQNTPEPTPPAVLVADEIFIAADRELIARGNVEAFQGQVRMQAQEIRYDRVTGALTITGPIRLQEGDSIIMLADAAELDETLRTGLLTGARIVIDQQLQLTTAQVERVNERYNQTYKTAVTSCKTCEDGKPPLWQIRARRVIHDKEERQLYFEDAQFRIGNVPVFYFPRLRLPDPTVKRATGFLIPSYVSTSELEFGLKVPYFIALREDRDLTLTPYISSRTRTMEFRYRQAFVKGDIQFDGAVSRDDLKSGSTRSYLFGKGAFDLRDDFKLTFDIELSSDDDYLEDYSYSSKDRLDSQILVSRARKDEYTAASLINFHTLRETESNATQPSIIGDVYYQKRLFPDLIGGEFRLTANLHNHIRNSDKDIVGRDVQRFNTKAEWLRGWTLPGGLRAEGRAGIAGDIFNITQDSSTNQNQTQLSPFTTVALRYPMSRIDGDGATQFLEPVAQFAYTGSDQLDIPNEESALVDFDGGNLLSLSRFPSPDRRERGAVGAFGLNWSRFAPSGKEAALTLGQVIRRDADENFTESTGLSGTRSDYLVAGQIKTLNGWALTGRTLFDDKFDFSRAEILGSYSHKRAKISGSYLWLTDDPGEKRLIDTSELFLDGDFVVAKNWTASADWRYDLTADRASNTGLSLVYFNECVEIEFSARRRYTRSSSLEPTTSFGLSIGLRGFSARKGTETYSRTCG
ncbi:MAG: LPS assembly protein LptD [Pseudomonadota bacterium]